jgi:hypothetical protein
MQEGHTSRSCVISKAEDNPQAVSDDDKAFWSYIVKKDRLSTMAGVQESDGEVEEEVMDDGEDDSESDEDEMYNNVE